MTFTASNGIRVIPLSKGLTFALPGSATPSQWGINQEKVDALREFFQHEANHKPWHDAEQGEIWVLTIGPNTNAYQYSVADSYFEQVGSNGTKGIPALSTGITAGRRIWPEESPSE